MTDQPGSDLDERAARAMGYTTMEPGPDWAMPEVLHWIRPNGDFQGSRPYLSIDPNRIEEMHRWVCSRAATVVLWWSAIDNQWAISASQVAIEASVAGIVQTDPPIEAAGLTIQHALALLVVAVADASV